MTHLLIDDVALLKPEIGELDPDPSDAKKAYRRFYIRAVFALVEAFVEQHRRLLVDLCDAGMITLTPKKLTALREISEVTLPDVTFSIVARRESNFRSTRTTGLRHSVHERDPALFRGIARLSAQKRAPRASGSVPVRRPLPDTASRTCAGGHVAPDHECRSRRCNGATSARRPSRQDGRRIRGHRAALGGKRSPPQHRPVLSRRRSRP